MIKKIFISASAFFYVLFIPTAQALALGGGGSKSGPYFGKVDSLFTRFGGFIDAVLIPLIFSVALLVFVWGMFRFFVYGAHSEDDRSKGRSLIMWSIIGFVLMVSIWGIVNIFAEGLFGTSTRPPTLPGTPTL